MNRCVLCWHKTKGFCMVSRWTSEVIHWYNSKGLSHTQVNKEREREGGNCPYLLIMLNSSCSLLSRIWPAEQVLAIPSPERGKVFVFISRLLLPWLVPSSSSAILCRERWGKVENPPAWVALLMLGMIGLGLRSPPSITGLLAPSRPRPSPSELLVLS